MTKHNDGTQQKSTWGRVCQKRVGQLDRPWTLPKAKGSSGTQEIEPQRKSMSPSESCMIPDSCLLSNKKKWETMMETSATAPQGTVSEKVQMAGRPQLVILMERHKWEWKQTNLMEDTVVVAIFYASPECHILSRLGCYNCIGPINFQ
jgi:hypothetical protein